MLTAEQRQQWIDALRSGNYVQQHRCALRDENNRYCCLGVLADIVNPNLWEYTPIWKEWKWTHNGSYTKILPATIETRLAGMNDDGKSFKEIADYIESRTDI